MNNIVNTVPYIKTSREFPADLDQIAVIMTRTYIEVAASINARTIGIFPSNRPAITGESWYFDKNQRQQSFRQVYSFTTTASIPHGITLTSISTFSRGFGAYTDGTNWYGLIFGSNVAIVGQRSFYVDPTNIVFLAGAGAPALTSGIVVLEWISDA